MNVLLSKLNLRLFRVQITLHREYWKILFFGNDNFSMYSLKKLYLCHQAKRVVHRLDVVTTVSSKKPNPVQKFAYENNLNVYPWPPSPGTLTDFDCGVVVSFGHLIPKSIISIFPLGIINVHASLLPKWRGASPIIYSIANGDSLTGISIMRIKPYHFDTGNIILQNSCSIDPHELMPSLYEKLGILGASSLIESLSKLPDCLTNSIPQNEAEVSYAPRITADFSQVDWEKQAAIEVYNRFRALYGLYPLRTLWHGCVVKLKQVEIAIDMKDLSAIPGTVKWLKSQALLQVQCRTGVVIVNKLSIGGKTLNPADFYNGYLSKRSVEQWTFN